MGIAEGSSRIKKESKADFFQTPYLCTEALLKTIPFIVKDNTRSIIDPCEGKGAITKVLKDHGLHYLGLDKYPQLDYTQEEDFLSFDMKCDIIIANPPYKLKNEFIEHALEIANTVFMILPMAVVNYNYFHRNFLNRKEYMGRVLMTPKFFMNQEVNEDYSLVKGEISSYAWFYWASSPPVIKGYSFETYCDLDILKEELKLTKG